jgi:hypothetical protein
MFLMRTVAGSAAMLLAALASTAAALDASAHDQESGVRTVSVRGRAQLQPPVASNDDLRFSIDAHATFDASSGSPLPTAAWGTARISHTFEQETPPQTVTIDVAVDCVSVGGPTAVVTGYVAAVSPADPELTQLVKDKARLGFSVYDRGARGDLIGYAGPPRAGEPELRKCTAPAGYFTLSEGGYTVSDRR